VLPTRAEIDEERELPQRDTRGREIEQGAFIAQVLAEPQTGIHLIESMSRPTAEALARLEGLRR
jgi:thioesterase DpgC